jgi:putative membrane protein insertion efficiency factor
MIRSVLIALIHVYRWTLSPLLAFVGGPGSGCRFAPTCSEFALEALRVHGAWPGARLAAGRLLRCHPWGPWGFDPVPPLRSDRFVQHPLPFASCPDLPPTK